MIGLSADATLYALLSSLTFSLHFALVGYVVAGTAVVALAAIHNRDRSLARLGDAYRDWLPFYLGAAITAGVAPLLFVQILYQHRFYTANLLLSHRWLLLIPALMLGFYCLYLVKAKGSGAAGRRYIVAGSLVALGCFLFAAVSWTENHLLAMDDGAWVGMYERGESFYRSAGQLSRLARFLCLAAVSAAAIGGLQTRDEGARKLAGAIGELSGILAIFAIAWVDTSEGLSTGLTTVAAVGAALTSVAFDGWRRAKREHARAPLFVGLTLLFVAVGWAREVARVKRIGADEVTRSIERVADSQGEALFAIFAILSAAVLIALGRSVLRQLDSE